MFFNNSVSNQLIFISAIFTIVAYFFPNIYSLWINTYFLDQWLIHIYFFQLFIWTFLHWWILHFLFNSIFIYIFWNIVEQIIWYRKFIIFFIFSVLFIWVLLNFVNTWNTVWISGFCMAIISYYSLELKSRNNPDYKWWLTAIVINVWIWLMPWISLFWHLFWVIAWVIFYLINKNFFKAKLVWFDIEKS